MIGDVSKAEEKLGKILGQNLAKRLSARVEKAESQNWTAANVTKQVNQALGVNDNKNAHEQMYNGLLGKVKTLKKVVDLLSTRPHTTSGSNFKQLVTKNVDDPKFKECLEKIYGNKNVDDQDIAFLDRIGNDLDKYLKRTGIEVKKYKTIEDKMQSKLKVNRLKVSVTALIVNLIDYAKGKDQAEKNRKQEEQRKPEEELQRQYEATPKIQEKLDREEQRKQEKQRKQEEEKRKLEAERLQRWPRGEVTLDEFSFSLLEDWRYPKLVIPEGVTDVGRDYDMFGRDYSFENVNLKEVYIPGSVKKINSHAFYHYRNLEKVTIATGVEGIGSFAFSECKIQSITIPGSVKTIGVGAFSDCKNLEVVTIKDGTTTIEDRAFEHCEKLKTITVPKSVTNIGSSIYSEAFRSCYKDINVLGNASDEIKKIIRDQADLDDKKIRDQKARDERFAENIRKLAVGRATKEDYNKFLAYVTEYHPEYTNDEKLILSVAKIVIPEGVEELRGDFWYFKNLQEVVIPNSVHVIPGRRFAGMQKLIKVQIPSGVTKIEDGAFENSGLKEVVIPGKVQRIEGSVFSGCGDLEKVEIRDGVEFIAKNAFNGCKNLKTITIPKSIAYVDENAFSGCPKNMEIKGNANEGVIKRIRSQIGAEQ